MSNEGKCPFSNMSDSDDGEPTAYGQSDLSYNDYLKVPELLALQSPQSTPPHHDELLFIIIHQSYELWFKLILHEVESVIARMEQKQILHARHHLSRMVEVMRLLVSQIHILETMTPADFLAFRDRLKPASGFQSLQFRELEFVVGLKDERYYAFFKKRPEVLAALEKRFGQKDLRSVFFGLLRAQGLELPNDALEREGSTDPTLRAPIVATLLPYYSNPHQHFEIYLLMESMVDFDQQLGLWREHHVRVVERIIGHKRGTGGSSGVDYLQATTSKKCFPSLWEVRTAMGF